MARTTDRWVLYTCFEGELTPISRAFKTRKLAEKARLKYPEEDRGKIGVGFIQQPAKAKL